MDSGCATTHLLHIICNESTKDYWPKTLSDLQFLIQDCITIQEFVMSMIYIYYLFLEKVIWPC